MRNRGGDADRTEIKGMSEGLIGILEELLEATADGEVRTSYLICFS